MIISWTSSVMSIVVIKVKVIVGLQKLPHLPVQIVRFCTSARKLIIFMYVHFIPVYKIYQYSHAKIILRIPREW